MKRKRGGGDHWLWFISALTLVALFLLLLVTIYRVPWGGPTVDRALSGPVSEWFANMLTGVGIIGLIYQLNQLRDSRVDETLREVNSLATSVERVPWNRESTSQGSLYLVTVVNFGQSKAMDVQLSLLDECDVQVPHDWLVGSPESASIMPGGDAKALWQFHVPDSHARGVLGSRSIPKIEVTWVDPWARRVRTRDNGPAEVLDRSVQA